MPGSTRSYEMAIRLAKKGHDVHIISSKRDAKTFSKEWKIEKKEGISVHWIDSPYHNHMSFYRRAKSFIYFAFYASKRGVSIGGDLVFATSTPLTIALPAIKIKKKLKINMVFEVRDLWPEIPIALGIIKNPLIKYFSKKLEFFSYKNSVSIIGLSEGMCSGIIKTGYNEDSVFNIPNGCDIEFFQKIDHKSFELPNTFLRNGDSLVVYLGTLGIINGVDYLVEIAGIISKKNAKIKFLIIGDGKMRNQIINKAKDLGILNKNLLCISQVPKNDIPRIMQLATVSTSLFLPLKEMENNSANKFFDSLAAGVPIVINYGGWQKKVITKYNAGLRISNNPNIGAEELLKLLNNKIQIKEMSRNALSLAKLKFSREKLSEKFIAILEDSLDH